MESQVPQEGGSETGGAAEGMDSPRREASARFTVAGVESERAKLREALDPANQSLAEALRLSYRVLQVGIVGLVAVFLFSGFQTVKDGHTGVKTIFGRIQGTDGEEALSPGLQPFWPYPIGEIEQFQARRTIRLDREFLPFRRPNEVTREEQIENAEAVTELFAGRDGFLVTADGDLAHLAIDAEYAIDDAVRFLRSTSPDRIDGIVRAALRRGAVQMAAEFTLKDLVESRDLPAQTLQEKAQEALDATGLGVRLVSVSLPERSPPRRVESRFREVQAKREDAKTTVERARQEVATILTGVAGERVFGELRKLIADYEAALLRGDRDAADAILASIGARFDRDDLGGEAARIVQRAKAKQVAVEANLAKEVRRLNGLLASYRENPRQLVRQLWLEAVATVLAGNEVEVFSAPLALEGFDLRVASSPEVMQTRRNAALERKKRSAEELNLLYSNFQLSGQQMNIDTPGRRLERDASGGAGR
jgi:regulator of protease activity HflC (stomatin/prohibitin superfamily)